MSFAAKSRPASGPSEAPSSSKISTNASTVSFMASSPVAARLSGAPPVRESCLHQGDMGGDDAPAFGQAHPTVGLAAGAAGPVAVELGAGGGVIAAEGRDHGPGEGAVEAPGRARPAKGADLR